MKPVSNNDHAYFCSKIIRNDLINLKDLQKNSEFEEGGNMDLAFES